MERFVLVISNKINDNYVTNSYPFVEGSWEVLKIWTFSNFENVAFLCITFCVVFSWYRPFCIKLLKIFTICLNCNHVFQRENSFIISAHLQIWRSVAIWKCLYLTSSSEMWNSILKICEFKWKITRQISHPQCSQNIENSSTCHFWEPMNRSEISTIDVYSPVAEQSPIYYYCIRE